ncbi:TolB family protein [Cryptosporangium sp. NPDC051539]|uniref:TolB family protein n=1 Tax=Cryptosporangium sp. NPDC051539 TaxID=3363962 RepID=UPI0037A119CB
MRFLRGLVTLAITVCVALLLVAIAGYGSSRSVADQRDRKAPAKVFQPFGWQQTVENSPPGPATVLVSGDGWGMRGVTYRAKVAVVGGTGVYRTQRYRTDVEAGEDVLLSPDGTLIADGFPRPVPRASGSTAPASTGNSDPAIWFTDLESGKTSRMTVPATGTARPVAFSPNGRKILVQVASPPEHGPWNGGELDLMDLATGEVARLADLGTAPVHRAQLAAFSPDGRRVAVQIGDSIHVIDVQARSSRLLARVGPDRRIAGVGAWSSDGNRIAVATMSGCSKRCTSDDLDDRTWQIDELDAETGAPSTGSFDRLTGSAVRVLGQTDDGELVVVRYRASGDAGIDGTGEFTVDGDEADETDYRAVHEAELLGLSPSGKRRTLLTLPPGSRHVDVAGQLIVEDRFGGDSSRPMPWPAPFWVNLGAIVVLLIVAWGVFRIRRLTR